MRRIALLLLVLLSTSCFYRPVIVEGPPVPRGIGSSPRKGTEVRRGDGRVQVCHEISRSRCDAECKTKDFDMVTLACGGTQVKRCEVGKGGC